MSPYVLLFIITNIFSLPTCEEFKNNCNKCSPLTNLCVKCKYDDILAPDKDGGCIGRKYCSIGNNYCEECDLNGELCKKCENGYFPDKNGGCAYTDNCKLSTKGECIECETDYLLIGINSDFKICKYLKSEDLKNCKIIDEKRGKCLVCEEDFHLNSVDRKCTKIQNCKESIYGNCLSCNLYYYLNKKNNTCETKTGNFSYCKESFDGKKCDICDEDTYLSEDGICVMNNYCSKTLNEKCQKCITNYYLTGNSYCSNTDNCRQADKDTGICEKCQDNYYLDKKDFKCKSNQENNDFKFCQIVINDECKGCIQGYKLSEDLRCTPSRNCLEANIGECILCIEGYHLGLDNLCTNIEHCIYSDTIDRCIECEDGYYFNKKTNNCEEEEELFKNCKLSDGADCSECKRNYYLDLDNRTCIDNTQKGPFYKCAFGYTEEGYCNECIEGYYIGSLDMKCSLIEDCRISENENTCIECDEYLCLDVKKGICVLNYYIEKEEDIIYVNCIKTNKEGTACETCMEGYEVGEGGYCIDVERCIEKKDGECLRCTDELNDNGFWYCANKIFGCIETTYKGCSRCDELLDLYNCTECKEGYEKIAGYVNCMQIENQTDY
jgi:hypothetical protein